MKDKSMMIMCMYAFLFCLLISSHTTLFDCLYLTRTSTLFLLISSMSFSSFPSLIFIPTFLRFYDYFYSIIISIGVGVVRRTIRHIRLYRSRRNHISDIQLCSRFLSTNDTSNRELETIEKQK